MGETTKRPPLEVRLAATHVKGFNLRAAPELVEYRDIGPDLLSKHPPVHQIAPTTQEGES